MSEIKFNESQQEAVDTLADKLLIVAGPGSGKTEVLAARIAKRIAIGAVHPFGVVAITYTHAAARELQARIQSRLHDDPMQELGYIGTLHGFMMRLLRKHGYLVGLPQSIVVMDENTSDAVLERCKAELKFTGTKGEINTALAWGPEVNATCGVTDAAARVAKRYFDLAVSDGVIDFDRVLWFGRRAAMKIIVEHFDYSELYVDEVQDASEMDMEIYLALPFGGRTFIGDPDQAVFGFRGGDVKGIMNLSRDPRCKTVFLEENYRSGSEICESANKLIAMNMNRMAEKRTVSRVDRVDETGAVTLWNNLPTEAHECAAIVQTLTYGESPGGESPIWGRWQSVAVLCRTNAIAKEIREYLQKAGLPVAYKSQLDLPKDWSRALELAALVANPSNDWLCGQFLRPVVTEQTLQQLKLQAMEEMVPLNRLTLKLPSYVKDLFEVPALLSRHVGSESVARCERAIALLPGGATVDELAGAMAGYEAHTTEIKESEKAIMVGTLHGAKGREFDAVFLPAWNEGILPSRSCGEHRALIEEECRLAYVGITRARKSVFISTTLARRDPWKKVSVPQLPSRFWLRLEGKA